MDTPLRLTEEIPRGAAPTRESGEEDAAANRSSVHVHKQTNASEEMIKLPFMIALLSKRSLICSQTRGRCAIARSYESFISVAAFRIGDDLDLVNRPFEHMSSITVWR